MQPDLFAPYQSHSSTSKAAAASIRPKVSRLEGVVLHYFRLHPDGGTDEDAEDFLKLGQNTTRPRRVGLVRKGYLKDSGARRKLRSGRKGVVWKIAD